MSAKRNRIISFFIVIAIFTIISSNSFSYDYLTPTVITKKYTIVPFYNSIDNLLKDCNSLGFDMQDAKVEYKQGCFVLENADFIFSISDEGFINYVSKSIKWFNIDDAKVSIADDDIYHSAYNILSALNVDIDDIGYSSVLRIHGQAFSTTNWEPVGPLMTTGFVFTAERQLDGILAYDSLAKIAFNADGELIDFSLNWPVVEAVLSEKIYLLPENVLKLEATDIISKLGDEAAFVDGTLAIIAIVIDGGNSELAIQYVYHFKTSNESFIKMGKLDPKL